MKHLLVIAALGCCAHCIIGCGGRNKAIEYKETGEDILFLDTLHDFGIIPQDNPLDSFDFKFVNHTGAAMMVLAVETSCECTMATYPHVAVPDGDTSYIHVVYDGRGRGPEAFFRQVMVTTSNADEPYLLEIYGEVK